MKHGAWLHQSIALVRSGAISLSLLDHPARAHQNGTSRRVAFAATDAPSSPNPSAATAAGEWRRMGGLTARNVVHFPGHAPGPRRHWSVGHDNRKRRS
jgi:hypothetical protein